MPALSTGDLGKRLSVALGIGPDMPMSRRGSTMNTLTRSDSNLHLNRGTGYEDAGANGKNMVRREAGVGVKLASSREEEVMVPFVRNLLTTHQVHVINTKVKLSGQISLILQLAMVRVDISQYSLRCDNIYNLVHIRLVVSIHPMPIPLLTCCTGCRRGMFIMLLEDLC